MVKKTVANRFEIDTEGMKALHSGRPLWSLVKELVANTWDEPTTTTATVEISVKKQRGKFLHEVVVEDNGSGFSDVTDAFTLMRHTDKRFDPKTRGRFNIGEKEIISIAETASVETVGTTVTFPKNGGRKVEKNDRTNGTVITANVLKETDMVLETVERLCNFIPPKGITTTINGTVIESSDRTHVADTSGQLQTVLTSKDGQMYRHNRKADIEIYEPRTDASLYEMGIYIQPIEAPYDVNIMQKVPLPPNRDAVYPAYIQDVYAEVLKATSHLLDGAEASEPWVQMAIEDDRTDDKTVAKVLTQKLGENAVLWSSDTQANERAFEDGKDVIHPRTLSKKEKEKFQKVGLVSATAEYKLLTNTDEGIKFETLAKKPEWKNVEEYTKWLSFKLLGFEGTVNFISPKMTGDNRIAQYGGKTLDFVPQRLGKAFFQMDQGKPTQQQTELILHELAHHNPSDRPHTGDYLHTFAELSAKAVHLALEGDWFVGQGS